MNKILNFCMMNGLEMGVNIERESRSLVIYIRKLDTDMNYSTVIRPYMLSEANFDCEDHIIDAASYYLDLNGYARTQRQTGMNVEEILARADVIWADGLCTGRTVISRNYREPLTKEEQEMLYRMWVIQGFHGDISFKVRDRGDV